MEIKKHLAFSQLSTLQYTRVVDREFSESPMLYETPGS